MINKSPKLIALMAMPKGWTSQANTTTHGSSSKNVGRMPTPTRLSRPMISPNSIPSYNYQIKKIEIYGTKSGGLLNTKHIKYLEIHPIESDYSLELLDGKSPRGFQITFQSLNDVKLTQTRKGMPAITFSFVGNGLVGESNEQYLATIMVEEEFMNKVFEVIKVQKELENDNSYWNHESLSLHTQYGEVRNIDVYPLTPFLAEGEDMIWQNIHYYPDRKEREIERIDAITNYRIFQYNYDESKGAAILFSSLQNVDVSFQERSPSPTQIGSYFISSFNLTGIKNVRTNSVLGDVVFYSANNSQVTFAQVTDPETLSFVVNRLKQLYDQTGFKSHGFEKQAINRETNCPKCGITNNSESRFCGNCGSALSSHSEVKPPIYIENPSLKPPALQDPEKNKIERLQNLTMRIDQYKPAWDKNGVIQYKTEYIAVLQRSWGRQVEFIIAFDDLTKEGYRLMAIDEEKSGGDSSGGFTGGVNAYFYFQKIKYASLPNPEIR